MKRYRLFVEGEEVPGVIIKASNHNAAEAKAKKMYPGRAVSVEYTEL